LQGRRRAGAGSLGPEHCSTFATLRVNDRQITKIGDDSLDSLTVAGFVMDTDRPPATIDFDNLVLGVP
jgi:hypothetical protein